MVFDDLGARLTSLIDPLLQGTAEEAERALSLYATALGRLHSDTVGCLNNHHETFESVFGPGRPRRDAVEGRRDGIISTGSGSGFELRVFLR